ncbi:MAG: sulfotransferase [Gammaproteobacteria bacterium]|nr:sulfotransferase [Gammaproteobacteria bacterium]MDH3372931.1 sulfotransferase [Gammaproteobacteria bacterium]MDH3409576.1 sulfotransferase [Gammaproteobacteria bacterium]MDH3552011.1 sulfotransferase [Gammaproteobacteria bacterium]
MDLPSDFKDALIEARKMHAQGRLLEAERIYRVLAAPGPHRGIALESLADLYVHQQRLDEAHSVLSALTEEDPDNLHYCTLLANFFDSVGQTQAAIDEYLRLLQRQPDCAVAHFNLALLYKNEQYFSEAMAAYENAVRLGIDQVEEVYSNMGTLYSEMQDAEKAREMYERALEISPDYVPALFNLAGHFEESGEKQLAIEHYERILCIDPRHWKSLARLAYPEKITAEDRDLIDRLKACVDDMKDDKRAQEGLYFALGKAYDDLESYDEASAAFVAANELSKERVRPYAPAATEKAFDQLIDIFSSSWIERATTDSEVSPIFICGMYRSGSTLLERMLAAHPAIAAGGELNTLAWLISRHLGPFPQAAAAASREQLGRIAEQYDARVRELVPDSPRVTDKRPDNFLRLGLIRAIFPAGKIIQTRRDIRGNSLSLYFQQFDRAASYANDLQHIVHYYEQQERLFAHWQACFGDSICVVDYEELVVSPEPVLRRVLEFLGLEWDVGVLDFQKSSGLVKTASIWQVRQGLHSRSKDRWRNYGSLLGSLTELAPPDETPA